MTEHVHDWRQVCEGCGSSLGDGTAQLQAENARLRKALEEGDAALADAKHSLEFPDELEWGKGSIEVINKARAVIRAALK